MILVSLNVYLYSLYLTDFCINLALQRSSPRASWKDSQHKWPVLASIARDIMSIPATGAGVERLFNSARDICHYRRGSLKPKTIQDIMMFMCTTRFDLQENQRLILQEYLTSQEIAASTEASSTDTTSFEPISDTEEDVVEQTQSLPVSQLSLNTVLGRRQRSSSLSEGDEIQSNPENDVDEDGGLPLPRSSGRVRKVSRRLDGYIVDRN